MNPHIARLNEYPFERLAALKNGATPPPIPHIALSIGEPKHPPAAFLVDALVDPETVRAGVGNYPATRGSPTLREAIADWLARRFNLATGAVDPDRNVLPVNGTREALFSFGQAVLSGRRGSAALMPNPFYQIYEGAALLRGAEPVYVACPEDNGFKPDFDTVPDSTWDRVELVYVCSPGNPTGAILERDDLLALLERADRHDFVIAADECYSEIFADEDHPPMGLLAACRDDGRDDFQRCMVFHSLSKRSNLPGLRSGFVAGDASLLAQYYRYRTYHGCAMPDHVQAVSALAWADEDHVIANRAVYREKFGVVTPLLNRHLELASPAGAFYYWARTPSADTEFARALFEAQNVSVLPGSFLAREGPTGNPGRGRIRMALVATLDECRTAAARIAEFVSSRY